jgi:hypothetical protein
MAKVLKELATDVVRSEAGSSTRRTTRKRVSPGERTCEDGTERLRCAANRVVGEKSEEIVGALSDKAVKGDLASVKALVEFAEGRKPQAEAKKKRDGLTPAQELMEDLRLHGEWKGEQEEGFGELGWGGLEPEDGD